MLKVWKDLSLGSGYPSHLDFKRKERKTDRLIYENDFSRKRKTFKRKPFPCFSVCSTEPAVMN